MRTKPRRAAWLAGLISAALISFGAGPALAASSGTGIDPNADTELVIHKLIQPEVFGEPATGHEDPSVTGTPVSGVTFTATRVPGIDLTTRSGWDDAQKMTVSEAAALTQGQPVAGEGTTGGDGVLALDLNVGLFLVQETAAPADIVPAAPFLVAMPHTNGDGQWLYTVHVYPKNAVVSASIGVQDVDAVTCGDTVSWASQTDVPHQENIEQYIVQNILASGVLLASPLADVRVSLQSAGTLPVLDADDYVIKEVRVDGRVAIEVEFTEAGRAKLVTARSTNPSVTVSVAYVTTVLVPGSHVNEVRLLAGNAGLVNDTAETRFGPLKIKVHEKGKPDNVIEGAVFELYLTAEDAAARRNPIIVDATKQWTTDKDGMITIGCLRFSDFVNGVDIPKTDPNYRYYYAQPISYPEGWIGDMEPLAGVVNSTVVSQATVLEFEVRPPTPPGPNPPGPTPDPKPTPPGKLPVTGAQVAGVGLLALVLLGAGSLFLIGKRRDKPTEEGAEQ